MSSHGILHQSYCSYTPQHSGVAERKNRHLVEIACILLLHHKAPRRLWRDVILSVFYLINCMPSSFLHDKIPHSINFPNQPLFCLPPQVFGCVCFVHILTLGQDKLSANATKCVFLGYSWLQRGYCCYSLDTHRYFVSTNVTFFENSSMFPTTHTPSSDVISLHILYLVQDTSFVSPATPPRPLQVYTRCSCTNTEPSAYSSPMAPSSMTPVLPSPTNLPIAVWNGTHSSCKPHHIYNLLTYHHLSSPYSVFISTLSFVSFPKIVNEALSHLGSNRQWLKK